MELFERDEALAVAASALELAAAGQGQILLVSGEAGIGKSAFVLALQSRFGANHRFLMGGCDELLTPRPYGPLLDIARLGLDRLGEALAGGELNRILNALLDDLAAGFTPAVVVIEDLHWVDDASLDALTALARRLGEQRLTLVLTYRDLPQGHAAFSLVGGLPSAVATRIQLQPLSIEAVGELAGGSIERNDDLYATTKGNPFFVTELLAARNEGVPATVADAVLARTATLPAETCKILELLSVVPGRVSVDFLDELAPDWLDHIEPAEERGIIEADADIQFRHTLARQAIEASLSATKRRRHSRKVLTLLLDRVAPLAQIVHHARQAGATDVVAEYAPRAAREAAAAAAHREAIDHFLLAIEHRNGRHDDLQADLHDELSRQLWFAGRQEEALAQATEAIELLNGSGDPTRLGAVLRSAANLCEWSGDPAGCEAFERSSVAVLEPLGPSAELAMLFSDIGIRKTMDVEIDEGRAIGEHAVEIAEQVGDEVALAVTYTAAAYGAHWAGGRADAWDRALEFSGHATLEPTVVAYCNRAFVAIERMEDAAADAYLQEASRFSLDHQATAVMAFATLCRARLAMKRGEWLVADEELATARDLVDFDSIGPAFRIEHDYCAGRLASRRGSDDAPLLLERAWATSESLDQLGRALATAAAFAEYAATQNRLPDAIDRLLRCDRILEDPSLPWSAEIAYWLWRAETFDGPVPGGDHPRFLSMQGDWWAAAERWGALDRPYERAEALTFCPETERRLEGLAILDELDAAPLAAITRKALREAGVENVPRGPNRSTRNNQAGLTARQLDVLELVVHGRTNAEIAEQLFVSVRTVDTHVGAILQKLGVASRSDAAHRARDLDIV